MSIFQDLGLSLSVKSSLPQGMIFLYSWAQQISGWSHTKAANMGDVSATCQLAIPQLDIEEWLEFGLGRWVELYDNGNILRFKGFVNSIVANIGGLTITRGPLLDVGNRVKVVYSAVDTTTTPPTMGVRAVTAVTNNTASQGLYGIFEKNLSTGGSTAVNAVQLRDLYIAENAYPDTSKSLNIRSSNLNISLNILGTWSWLNAYTANFTTTGTVNLSARIIAILGLSPNAVFSTDYGWVTANTWQVPAYENDDKIAAQYMQSLIPIGDVTLNRYIAGFRGDRQFYYQAVPTTVEYLYHATSQGHEITNRDKMPISPWEVEPGKWMFLSDFMVGRSDSANLRDDPRAMFIENVTYSIPMDLAVSGATISTLNQKIAQLGLGGMGG